MAVSVSLGCVAAMALLAGAGCSRAPESTPSGGGTSMSGSADAATIVVTRAALESTPQPWVLATPESAVRSYLAWTSYAYRIGDSRVATDTMTGGEGVRVDAYIQLNLQKYQLIDQELASIAFGKPSIEGTRATVPAKETWRYRYVSTKDAGRTVAGPYSASYDATYTVVKSAGGRWVVDSAAVKALGAVK